jgi:GTP cyclohydrolase II
VRSVYELSFIHCTPEDAEGASLFYLNISDIDLKFKNEASEEYCRFADFMQTHGSEKCILIRKADVANVYFPEIFIAKESLDSFESDQESLKFFLHDCLRTTGVIIDLTPFSTNNVVSTSYQAREVAVRIGDRIEHFCVEPYIFEEDDWKFYYVLTHRDEEKGQFSSETFPIFLRIDSGCVTGQLYDDCSCNCGKELAKAMESLIASPNPRSLLIHIPTQDGRGFGSAPKGETEIYKRGGQGKVHNAETRLAHQAASELLYGVQGDVDIRTYEKCAEILQKKGISSVLLSTVNSQKIAALTEANISVSI